MVSMVRLRSSPQWRRWFLRLKVITRKPILEGDTTAVDTHPQAPSATRALRGDRVGSLDTAAPPSFCHLDKRPATGQNRPQKYVKTRQPFSGFVSLRAIHRQPVDLGLMTSTQSGPLFVTIRP